MITNNYHRKIARWLSERGVSYMEEYPAGPYTLDLYLGEQKLAVEIDGPGHNGRKDAERDKLILDWFEIRTVRIKVGAKKKLVLEAILGRDS